jgi:hypothetical protein
VVVKVLLKYLHVPRYSREACPWKFTVSHSIL